MEKVKLKIEGKGEFEVDQGKKLVLALREDAKVEQIHACGGKAKCTSCKVQFLNNEPSKITVAEKNILKERGLSEVRLSCQILCDTDMEIKIINSLEQSKRVDCGTMPNVEIEPTPEWDTK